MPDQLRQQVARNHQKADLAELKQLMLEAMRDPDFRREFWHELRLDARRAQARNPGPARTIGQARDMKAARSGRQGG